MPDAALLIRHCRPPIPVPDNQIDPSFIVHSATADVRFATTFIIPHSYFIVHRSSFIV